MIPPGHQALAHHVPHSVELLFHQIVALGGEFDHGGETLVAGIQRRPGRSEPCGLGSSTCAGTRGTNPPVICTPSELMEVSHGDQ